MTAIGALLTAGIGPKTVRPLVVEEEAKRTFNLQV